MLRRVALVRANIPEDTILHSHRSENLKSYMRVDSFKDALFKRSW
jgi:hypothetical protein